MKKKMLAKSSMKYVAVVTAICIVITLIGGTIAFAGVMMKKAKYNSQRLDMLNTYRTILEENKGKINIYRDPEFVKNWQCRMSYSSVKKPCCIFDVDGDGEAELIFFTFRDDTKGGVLHIYSYKKCGAKELATDKEYDLYLDINVAAGSDYMVYTSVNDNYLHVYYSVHGEGDGTFLTLYQLTEEGLRKKSEYRVTPACFSGISGDMERFDDPDEANELVYFKNSEKIDHEEGERAFKEDMNSISKMLFASKRYKYEQDFDWEEGVYEEGLSDTYKKTMQKIDSEIEKLEDSSDNKDGMSEELNREASEAYFKFLESRKDDKKLDWLDNDTQEIAEKQDAHRRPVIITDLDSDGVNELLVYVPNKNIYMFDLELYSYRNGKVIPAKINTKGDNVLFSVPLNPGNGYYCSSAFCIGEDKIAVEESDINYDCITVFEFDNGELFMSDQFVCQKDEDFKDEYLVNDSNEYDYAWEDDMNEIVDGTGTVIMKMDDKYLDVPEFGDLSQKLMESDEASVTYDDAVKKLKEMSSDN